MKKMFYRLYQFFMRVGSYFVSWRKPELIEGQHSIMHLSTRLIEKEYKKVLIVTDENLYKIGLMDTLISSLKKNNVFYSIYKKTVPNPSIKNVEEALKQYKENDCEAVIAFGGGSPIDCAKGVIARLAKPKKSVQQLKGYFKIRRKTVPLIAIPTTAGSGSEATIAAVVSDGQTHEKFAINDTKLIPNIAVLDPELMINLPKQITSTTGMDALTHAIEAYIGKANTRETKEMAIKAIKLIFNNLEKTFFEPENISARMNMQKASYYAGVSFTRAYVGYVHALSHQLGGLYSTPHGLANAVLLPNVLEYYGDSVYKKIAELYDMTMPSKKHFNNKEKTKQFIQRIRDMNETMNIPKRIEGIKIKDLDLMVLRACKEANPHYPVPKILSKDDLKNIYQTII